MYVCLCNALTERDVHRAIGNGCSSPGQVYRMLGTRPQCGMCVAEVRDMVRSSPLVAEPAWAGDD